MAAGAMLLFGLLSLVLLRSTDASETQTPSLIEAVANKPPWFCHEINCPNFTVEEGVDLGPDIELRSYDSGASPCTPCTTCTPDSF